MNPDPFMLYCQRQNRHQQLGRDHRLVAAGRLAERHLRHLDAEQETLAHNYLLAEQGGWLDALHHDADAEQRRRLQRAEADTYDTLELIELHQEVAAAELAEAVATLELTPATDLSRPPCWRSALAVSVATHRPVMQSCAPATAPPLQPGTHHLPQGASTYA
jgi:hypothetical protein